MGRYTFNGAVADTTAGQPGNPFSPPEGWAGDAEAFTVLVRARFKTDPGCRQRLGSLARYHRLGRPYAATGPWAEPLRAIIAASAERKAAD